jgi:TupA-like ATPgrasp
MGGDQRRGAARAFKNTVRALMPEPIAAILAAIRRHKRRVGTYPNLLRPTTFNEKVLYRSLFDRRPIWTQLQDKHTAREYVRARIGEEALPRLYSVTQDPTEIPFDELPQKFVVKPNHGSGWIVLVPDKAQVNRQELIETCRGWLRQNYYDYCQERQYKPIVPCIMVEEYIDDGTGVAATQYNLHVFGGRVEVISIMHGGPQDIHRYRRPADVTGRWENIQESNDRAQDLDPPPHIATMIEYAEALGKGLDYIRVDLYDTPDKVYFGELTSTTGSGAIRFQPREIDRYLGKLWPRRTRTR